MTNQSIDNQPDNTINKWDKTHIPDLSGKIVIVTGANSGLGYEITKALAEKGAHVVMGCRSIEKGESATEKIKKEFPNSSLKVMVLDLADLSSVKNFCQLFRENYNSLDILCNNAGVMQVPKSQTVDNFEMHFGINHLGHFALTGLLIDILLNTHRSRIVTVSSNAHKMGKINFDDVNMDINYGRTSAYSRSKLANLLFTYELQKRLKNVSSTISVSAHPGYSATNLQSTGPGMGNGRFWLWSYKILNRIIAQSAEMGSLPILYAATAENVKGGEYIGPNGFGQWRGYPKKAESSKASHDESTAKQLWELSVDLTKINYSSLDEHNISTEESHSK